MKLYSKGQLFTSVAASIVVTIIITCTIFNIITPSKNTSTKDSSLNTSGNNSSDAPKYFETATSIDNTSQNDLAAKSVSSTVYTQDEIQNITVYDKCSPAVVNITTQVMGVNWFLEPIVSEGGSGSGSIIDKRGYVLTNVHVVKGASKIYVSLSDGTQYEATVTGLDEDNDLAVIKFNPPSDLLLVTIPFGDSDVLKVGQKVIAIGNPFGFNRTMTCGIISALGRPIKNSNNRIIRNMVQTDTAINPGNSGGPLLDTQGHMIGINTMIYSNSGSSSGIGFAVPSSTAARVVGDLIQYGKVHRGIIDANLVQLNNRIASYFDLPVKRGMLVSQTLKGGNAQTAGIRGGTKAARYGSGVIYIGGDIITQIDGLKVETIADYYSALESKKIGDEVTLLINRNGVDKTVTMKLADPDKE